uniref:Peptidase M16-like protein n=1 Tax=Phaselicystis flava TaxID=525924 RepID=A0A3S7V071_9BACT|nr:peptidase M16-like protein [Phaselicystis flava]
MKSGRLARRGVQRGITALGAAAALALVAAATSSHGVAIAAPAETAATSTKVDIPFTRYKLPNGLTVILHEDHALPLVAVNLMFKVGSRFEEPKRTGFAHLFEHLMFMGTARAPTKAFDAWMEAEGGWNNAWTSADRTDYFDIGPSHALPLLLWLEADRLSSLGKEMSQQKLDAQREVVRNERRQTSENRPYGKVELRLPELLYPEGHPYHHPVIGSHEDLQAATVQDVVSFFDRYYVPSNVSLVIAGDFEPATTRGLVEKYFGWIPPGSPPTPPAATPPKLASVVRETIPDDVQLPKVVMAWHSPAQFAPGDAELDLASVILEQGKASRLYKALVYDRPLAQEVSAAQRSQDLGSYFEIEAIAQPGVTLEKLEAAIDAEVKKIAAAPVTPEELARAKNQFETAFVSRLQSVAERASTLNNYETTKGDPGWAEKDLQRYRGVTAASLQATAKSVFDPNARVIVRVVPKEEQDAKGAAGKKAAPPKGGAK